MSTQAKISPAFEPFLEDSARNDKREAIVVLRASDSDEVPVRGRLLALKQRLSVIKERAKAQKSVQEKLFEGYRKLSGKAAPRELLATSEIGHSSLPVAAFEVTAKTLPELAELPEVVAILPNQKIHLIKPKEIDYAELTKQESKDGLTWALKHLEIPELWKTTKGKDIKVAVLDTGVLGEHPALAGRVEKFVVVDPLGRRIEAKPSFDCGTHGTHVCGTIAGGKTADGISIGVAPEATLLAAGVLIGEATVRGLLESTSWAIENGANIINMSLGFSYYEPLFAEVFKVLIEQYGIVPVVAIGNENHGNTSSPGNAHNAFSVGAVERVAGKIENAFFSSGASLVFPGDEPNALVTKPDVVAPGVLVYSCIPPQKVPSGVYEYSYMDGTSMATPHVAGVAALLMAAKPEASAEQIVQVLKETAKHPHGTERRPDNRWGYGLIQPIEALKALS